MYIYPQNLKATAQLWLWNLKDFMIIGVSGLLSILILTQTGVLFPLVITFLYSFLTIRLEETTVIDFIKYAFRYFISTQQYFEWRAS